MKTLIILFSILTLKALGGTNIIPESKVTRKPALAERQLDGGLEVIVRNRKYTSNLQCNGETVTIPNVSCEDIIKVRSKSYRGGGIEFFGDRSGRIYHTMSADKNTEHCWLGETREPPDPTGFQEKYYSRMVSDGLAEHCYSIVSTTASIKEYVDYKIHVNLTYWMAGLAGLLGQRVEQQLKEPGFQESLQKEAVRILEANAALRNQ
jgi:hypothetical protein